MPVDYNSTSNWNDPYNPWPKYSQVKISASDIQGGALLTYNLITFDPTASSVFYSANTESGNYFAFGAGTWYVIAEEELNYYTLATTTRTIPGGWVQGNTSWISPEGDAVESLSIIPVTTSRTPWERRRKRLLGYI